MMLRLLKRQFAVQMGEHAVGLAVMLGGWLCGLAIHALIKYFAKPEGTVPLGTILAAVAAVIFLLFVMIGQVTLYYNIEVGMGLTRRYFCLTHFAVGILEALWTAVVLVLLCAVENLLNGIFYPDNMRVVDLLPCLRSWAFPCAMALCAVGNFTGTLLMRFGRRGGWILWGIWMLLCIGLPQIIVAATEKADSPIGRIGTLLFGAVRQVPQELWLIILVLLGLACFAGAWALLRRHPVNI